MMGWFLFAGILLGMAFVLLILAAAVRWAYRAFVRWWLPT